MKTKIILFRFNYKSGDFYHRIYRIPKKALSPEFAKKQESFWYPLMALAR